VAIDIIDDGPGIPESERPRVFERFYRLDQARSRKEGGFGLGLAIARQAIELNGGTIGFHEKEGPGAWCRIVLPAKSSEHHPPQDPKTGVIKS
jgi:signal transduction histidine kinase